MQGVKEEEGHLYKPEVPEKSKYSEYCRYNWADIHELTEFDSICMPCMSWKQEKLHQGEVEVDTKPSTPSKKLIAIDNS